MKTSLLLDTYLFYYKMTIILACFLFYLFKTSATKINTSGSFDGNYMLAKISIKLFYICTKCVIVWFCKERN